MIGVQQDRQLKTEPDLELDLNLHHLQAEITRLDVMFQREILRWRRASQDPADTFRGLYVSHAEVDGLLSRPLAGNWGQTASVTAAEVEAFARAEAEARARIQAIIAQAERVGQLLRLRHLESAFGLSRFELDVLLLCLAPSIDLRYEKLYGYLQDDVTRRRPTVNLALDLLGETGLQRMARLTHFADKAPLFRYQLLERSDKPGAGKILLLNQILEVDETIVSWLFGHYEPHSDLCEQATLLWPRPEGVKADQLVVGSAWNELELMLEWPPSNSPHRGENIIVSPGGGAEGRAQLPILAFYGPDQVGQEAAARLCALKANRPLLQVNLGGGDELELLPLKALKLTLRDARLTGAIPCLLGWDHFIAEGENTAFATAFHELNAYPGLVIVASRQRWQPQGLEGRRTIRWIEFPVPAYTQRLQLWRHFLGQPELIEEADQIALAGQFALTGQQIGDAVAFARDIAGQDRRPLCSDDLFSAARTYSNPRLTSLARKISPRYEWDDIILPEDQRVILHEIVATVRGRAKVLEEWGVGRKLASSAGVTVLFAGPPGTGKTMAAEVIANELGLDLYKIDLSTVISKYIGETEKNLEKIFNEAQSSNAILFFDEADAIFGKRSEVKDAHDRYANIEISYLLQRMEAYDGVTILATNLRANLDEAFTRRLQFAVDFPFPEEADRLRIWQTLFPPDVPRTDDIDFGLFAQRFRLAGGNIRNIIVSAAYLAAADGGLVTMAHLLHGTRRELQKMGRWVEQGDLEIG